MHVHALGLADYRNTVCTCATHISSQRTYSLRVRESTYSRNDHARMPHQLYTPKFKIIILHLACTPTLKPATHATICTDAKLRYQQACHDWRIEDTVAKRKRPGAGKAHAMSQVDDNAQYLTLDYI